MFCLFKKCNVFYHYHAKGINEFTSKSAISKKLTNFFLKNVNLIFISQQMKSELEGLKGYKNCYFLNNGVEDNLNERSFEHILKSKNKTEEINILYLSNMIKEKGYDTVLNFAKSINQMNIKNVKFHFAGGWSSRNDTCFFNNFVIENKLEELVMYHGLVQGKEKAQLFKKSKIFLFPSRYKKEVFPLSVLEALSYGLPILAFNAGAISDIVNKEIGVITNKKGLLKAFKLIEKDYLKNNVYNKCRQTFLEKYTTQKFEMNLLEILNH
jgi:glycosyltransferase involved in cell wall biosynthesis